MAMGTDKKLYIAVGVLAALGGALLLQTKQAKQVSASHSIEGRAAELPDIKIKQEDADKIDKITIVRPKEDKKATDKAEGEGEAKNAAADVKKEMLPAITLAKTADKWQVTEPVTAEANQTNVTSLISGLKNLEVSELVDASTGSYGKYDVTDDSAVHVVFHKGAEVFREFWFGKGGGRGQMARVKGKEGVFAVKGYSKYSYERDIKDWRDRSIFKFEDKQAKTVSLTNENGTFEFEREGESWKGSFKKPKGGAAAPIKDLNAGKVTDLLNAYKNLNADGFGDSKTAADTGLDKPTATLLITLDDGGKREVKVGGTAEGSSRWIQTNQGDDIFSISSWAADWATSDLKKFQKDAKSDKPSPPDGEGEGESEPELGGGDHADHDH